MYKQENPPFTRNPSLKNPIPFLCVKFSKLAFSTRSSSANAHSLCSLPTSIRRRILGPVQLRSISARKYTNEALPSEKEGLDALELFQITRTIWSRQSILCCKLLHHAHLPIFPPRSMRSRRSSLFSQGFSFRRDKEAIETMCAKEMSFAIEDYSRWCLCM